MIYGQMGATIHTFSKTSVGGNPSTSKFNLVLGGGESAVVTLNMYANSIAMGGWKEEESAASLTTVSSPLLSGGGVAGLHPQLLHPPAGGLELETSGAPTPTTG